MLLERILEYAEFCDGGPFPTSVKILANAEKMQWSRLAQSLQCMEWTQGYSQFGNACIRKNMHKGAE